MFSFFVKFNICLLLCAESKGELTDINKTSTKTGNDYMWKRNYLALSQSVNASCDLTEDVCDSFCCEDTDCSEFQKEAFKCSDGVPEKSCNQILSYFDCNCGFSNKPEWFPFLCCEYGNPIYLGKFHEIPGSIDSISVFNNQVKRKSRTVFKHNEKHFKNVEKRKLNNSYRYGSLIKTYYPSTESYKFPIISTLISRVSIMNSKQACKLSSENYMINNFATCTTSVSKKLCDNGQQLGISSHLIQDDATTGSLAAPFILKSLHFLESSKTKNKIKCISLNRHSIKIGQKKIFIFVTNKLIPCSETSNVYNTHWNNETCYNVLAGVHRQFYINGTDIYNVITEYIVANVQVSVEFSDDILNDGLIFVKQTFNTTFIDKSNAKRIEDTRVLKRKSQFNRGYFMNEKLHFGFKNDSTTNLEKGFLGVFKNGGSCNNTKPIEFGFNYISRCRILEEFTTCDLLRNHTEEKLNELIRGDALAPSGNVRNSSEEAIPKLRNYAFLNQTWNGSRCLIHVGQDILIQYTTLLTKKGYSVHKVLGLRVDRTLRNVSLAKFDGFLTSRVIFLFVSSEKPVVRSKFWEKTLSAELSENAWLNILNAFDGEGTEENTFWCIAFALVILSALAVTRLNVDHDLFFM